MEYQPGPFVGSQMPKVQEADRVDLALKLETQATREEIPKPIPGIPKSMSQPKR